VPFLDALRSATGGIAIETVDQVWVHDLSATSRFTDLWPLLLVVALLLWPLDIAFRRVSIGRRELAAARGWIVDLPRRRRSLAPRPAMAEGLLAARDRATSSGTRSALRGEPGSETAATGDSAPNTVRGATPAASAPAGAAPRPAPAASAAPKDAPVVPAPDAPGPPAAGTGDADTMARLRDAKRRARER
jgi:hypothetical protein